VPLSRASFPDIIERIHTIPSLPEVVMQVVKLVNDPTTNAAQIRDLVIKDPGMAAKMLRMVNSVYYGLKEPVHGLEQAIQVLGFKTLRSIAMSISVINAFQQQNACFSMKAFWTHASVSASLAKLIAGKSNICDPELAFIIGLLRDIGKLVLVENAPDECRAIIAVAREYGLSFNRAAREVIDTDDAEIGAWLAEKWGMEPIIVGTIRGQYDASLAPDKKLVALCSFTEYICALKKIRVSGNCDQPTLEPQVWQELGLDKSSLMEVLTAVNAEVENARQLLRVAA